METRTLHAPEIHCGHCTARIERELGALPGVVAVTADAATKRVTVRWEAPATWEQVRALLDDLGYPPSEA